MKIRIENAGNITSAAIESAGITVLGGPNIEGRPRYVNPIVGQDTSEASVVLVASLAS